MSLLKKKDIGNILSWYDRNKRDLPFRKDKDPYHVWLSEIMLQQTRIETVIPYYERFLEEVPDISSLASLSDERLFKLWEGLGYYSRARNLKKAANVITEKYNGVFPSSYEEILSLPGIGPYTAGAIASIAFDRKEPAIDGNVLRVFSRYLKEERTVDDTSFRKELHHSLKEIYPKEAGNFTAALMEIGETVCLPNTSPLCDHCPLSSSCKAHKDRSEEDYPHMPQKKKPKEEERTVLLFLFRDTVALSLRSDSGLLAGLWEFPNIEGHFSEKELLERLKTLPVKNCRYAGNYTHRFSHILWDNDVWIIRCEEEIPGYTYVSVRELKKDKALPTAFRKCIIYLEDKES